MNITVKPYVKEVIQCYNFYKYGHLKKWYKSPKKCINCGKEFRGRCERDTHCINCERKHFPTNKDCTEYK